MAAKPRDTDEYLAALSDEQRTALEKLRKAIKAAAPEAEEKRITGFGMADETRWGNLP